jgi:hypothetical protein
VIPSNAITPYDQSAMIGAAATVCHLPGRIAPIAGEINPYTDQHQIDSQMTEQTSAWYFYCTDTGSHTAVQNGILFK